MHDALSVMRAGGSRTGEPGTRARSADRLFWIARDGLLAGLAVVLFLALSLKNIDLPALYYDEALDVVPAMQLVQGTPVEAVRGAGVDIGGRTLPLMVMDYVGTVNTYLAVPLFALLGVSVTSVRLLPVLLAALSLLLGYRLASRLFDWRVAAGATLLLAVDPSYVFFSRMGIHVTSVMTVFALGSLLAVLRWRDDGRKRWLALGGLLLGLGLWAKVLFLWWIIALAIMWGATTLSSQLAARSASKLSPAPSQRRTLRLSSLLTILAGLLTGALPLIAFNLLSGGTLVSFGRNALVTEHGVNNLDVAGNLAAAVQSFIVLLDGRYFWFMGEQVANRANVVAFAAAVAASLILIRRRPQWRGGLLLIGVLIAVIVAESAFTVSGIWATHLYILLPLPQIMIALGAVLLADTLAPRLAPWLPWGRAAIVVLLLGALMLASYRTDAAYYAAVERTGGLSRFSDAVYKLAEWLDKRQAGPVYAVDWGIQKNVQILTQGRVNPIELSGYAGEPPDAFVRRAEKALADHSAVFILHSKEDTVYELYGLFAATAERMGLQLKIIDATRDRSGAPVHVMWVAQ